MDLPLVESLGEGSQHGTNDTHLLHDEVEGVMGASNSSCDIRRVGNEPYLVDTQATFQ